MNKKKLWQWGLYDFANSIVFINFLLYFSQWMVIDEGLSDLWYNVIFAVTSIMLLLSAPTLASFTDKFGGRKYLLRYATVGTLLGYGLATIFAYLDWNIFLIALLFLVGQYFYQLSFVFYNSLIDEVSDDHHRARVSGIGQFFNSIGQVFGLLIALPLSATRLQPLFPSLILFVIFSLPLIMSFTDSKPVTTKMTLKIWREGERDYFVMMKRFFATSVAVPMLLAFFFFNDAMITLSNNYPIYMERVFSAADSTKNLLLLTIILMGGIGGLIVGWVADRVGDYKVLKAMLVSWILLIPLLAISKSMLMLTIVTAIMGFCMGPVWVVSRSYLSKILKKEEYVYGFSFYTLSERFATMVGPLTWGGIIAIFGTDSLYYRIAAFSLVIFVVIGLWILSYWSRGEVKQ